MIEYKKQKCPLCDTEAKYCLADHDEYKFFRCPVCTDFQISSEGESRLNRVTKEWLQKASDEAKNSEYEQVLIIGVVENSKLSPGQAPYPVMYFRHRSEIPQCR